MRLLIAAIASLIALPAFAHHEALFGPQSSLAVEAQGFVSLQEHLHAYGTNGQETLEAITIVSGGFQPIADVPLGLTLVQPFTYQTSRAPSAPGTTGPFSVCGGCFRVENTLLAAQYRFDFKRLQRAWDRDGNFALLSSAVELPTGNKDYASFTGPVNFIVAGMVGFERRRWAAVALGYYRINTNDATLSRKGDNLLAALGVAFTPIDRENAMLSFQLGAGYEHHLRDVANGSPVDESGGGQVLVSPTVVGSPRKNLRIFALFTLPVFQTMKGDANVERWRAGLGLIYSFDRSPEKR
jgi:hypothetical protein